MTTDQQLADFIRDVSIFALTHGGKKCCHGWSGERVYRYFATHHLNGSLFVSQDSDGIKAIGVAWKDEAGDLHIREVIGERRYATTLYNAAVASLGSIRRVFTWRWIKGSPKQVEVPYKAFKRFCEPLTLKT